MKEIYNLKYKAVLSFNILLLLYQSVTSKKKNVTNTIIMENKYNRYIN